MYTLGVMPGDFSWHACFVIYCTLEQYHVVVVPYGAPSCVDYFAELGRGRRGRNLFLAAARPAANGLSVVSQ